MKEKEGFTLIELMVAMGIIAVLVTMSVVAIQIVQRSLRDTQRRDVLNTVNLFIVGHFNDFGVYPDLNFATDKIENLASGGVADEIVVELSGATSNASSTSSNRTAYCYVRGGGVRGTYQWGMELESGAEVQLGNDSQGCTPGDVP